MDGKNVRQEDEIELDPHGWERFEHAVDAAIKAGPKHKTKRIKEGAKRQKRSRCARLARPISAISVGSIVSFFSLLPPFGLQ
jgi:hypothetical protein